jgi:hypothetical protein
LNCLYEFVDFFLLKELVNNPNEIKFYLLFDGFNTKPGFNNKAEYLLFKQGVIEFVARRNGRIGDWGICKSRPRPAWVKS